MCGIIGLVALTSSVSNELPKWLVQMSKKIEHRGPDGEGFVFFDHNDAYFTSTNPSFRGLNWDSNINYHPKYINQISNKNYRIGFGHRRLSIIDVSTAGHQPIASADGKIWLTFNGEIYNYLEIKGELIQLGYSFRTKTDTEVIIAAYQTWGKDCIRRFNGMFAWMLYDMEKQELWGVRDRTGVKPFYYIHQNGYLAFASELKALIDLPFYQKAINTSAVFDYFVLNTIEAQEESLFKGVFELPPSHQITINLKTQTVKTAPYYTLKYNPKFESFSNLNFQQHCSTVEKLIHNAIQLRLRSDVAVGSCLSGGIDSSVVVGTINELLRQQSLEQIGERQKVFTTCFENSQYDEQQWAKLVVDKTKATWHKTFPTKSELSNDLETLIYCQDIPMYSTSTYAQFRVMQLVQSQGVKVVLDGQGGDELFAGYEPHYLAYWRELINHFKWSTLSDEFGFYGSKGAALKFLGKGHLKYNAIPNAPIFIQQQFKNQYFNELSFINPDLLNEHKSRMKTLQSEPATNLNEMLHYEYMKGPLKQLLKCEDRCSMWFGIESRTPFADDLPLMEAVFQIPASYKIHQGTRKHLLRESMKNVLPIEIKNRKDKMGFVTPTNQWIRELKEELRPYFEEQDDSIFNKKALLKSYDNFFNPNTNIENYRIFKFISFAIWRKVFEV